jgi:putative DNA primase/helicase
MHAELVKVPVPVHSKNGQVKSDKPLPLTDLGLAERLVDKYGQSMRYCHPWGKWLCWDGKRWRIDESGMAMRLAKLTVRAIYLEAAAAETKEEADALGAFARRSESRARIEAMLALAQSEPGIPVMPEELDANPWLLNMGNGTYDFGNGGEQREHRREDLITKLVSVDYDPKADCPTWRAFLDRVLARKQPLICFLQRTVGYACTGSTRERVIFILFGTGRNGKSTFLEVIGTLLGDYAQATPTETLLARRDTGIPNDVAKLKGARFVSTVETDQGARLAEAKLKALSGRDPIPARFMRGEWFTFMPEFKLLLATNHKPVIRGTDAAIWDRIRLIPFEVRIPEAEEDQELPTKLRAELPGILAWAVQGCLDWQHNGLGTPSEVRVATNQYRAEMDTLADFLEDLCVVGTGLKSTAGALYDEYKKWCDGAGEKYVRQKEFGQQLDERGFTRGREGKDRTRIWIGIGLRGSEQASELPWPETVGADANPRRTREDAFSDMTGADGPYEGLYGKTRPLASAPLSRPPTCRRCGCDKATCEGNPGHHKFEAQEIAA